MDQAKQRAIASKGGQSVPPEKRSFSQNPQLAAQAGRKGGESVPPEGRSFSQNRELAAEAGRKGGQARGAASQRRAAAARQNGEMGTEASRGSGAPESSRRHMASVDIPSDNAGPYGEGYRGDENEPRELGEKSTPEAGDKDHQGQR
jgi:general stress protein YciG